MVGNDSSASRRQQSTQSTNSAPIGRRTGIRSQETRSYSRATFFAAEKTSAVRKINDGQFDDLTVKDIQLLFDVIDADSNGMIDFDEIRNFLREVLDPPCSENEVEAIYNLTDQNADGNVTPEEIYNALTSGPVQHHLLQLHNEGQVRQRREEMQGLNAEVDRDLLLEKVQWRVHRDDAFSTLPFTTFYMVIFTSVVVTHLQIWQRQQVERGLEHWIAGFGKDLVGPFLAQAVGNVDSTGFWLRESGLAAVLGECQDNRAGLPWCHLATRNVLVGGVELSQRRKDGTSSSEWLLQDSPQVRAHLASSPRDFLNASALRVRHLWDTGWADEDTEEVKLTFSTYNRRARMFAVTEVVVTFGHGFTVPAVIAGAATVDPYPSKAVFALDAVYCCLLLYPLVSELKDLIMTCRLQGMVEGCMHYVDFYNLIDWLGILIGCTGIVVWVLCCMAMQDESIQMLLGGDVGSQYLVPDVMQLDAQTLARVKDALRRVIELFFCLHCLMAANVLTIMLKFFKAFQANPRLQLVTDTLTKAGDDMAHWAVVFTCVFMGFALSGNILFGGDLIQFNSVGASLNTAFQTLMGEFDWYIEQYNSDLGMPSGLPVEFLLWWYWGFMVLVTLVLLNMLLAIILEHYAEVLLRLKFQEVPSIFMQTWGYVLQRRREKGFVPLSSVLALLEDEDEPAHEDSTVSVESLMKAFTMKDEQAELLMDWLQKEATERQKKEEGGEDSFDVRIESIEGFSEAMFEQLRVVCLNVSSLVADFEGVLESPSQVAAKRRGSMAMETPVSGLSGAARRLSAVGGEDAKASTKYSLMTLESAQDGKAVGTTSPGHVVLEDDPSKGGAVGAGARRGSSPRAIMTSPRRALRPSQESPGPSATPASSAWGQSLGKSVAELGEQVSRHRGAVQDISALAMQLKSLAAQLESPGRPKESQPPAAAAAAQEQATVLSSCFVARCSSAASLRSASAPPCKGRYSISTVN